MVGEGGRWKDTARGEGKSADDVEATGDWGMGTMSSAIEGQIPRQGGGKEGRTGNGQILRMREYGYNNIDISVRINGGVR